MLIKCLDVVGIPGRPLSFVYVCGYGDDILCRLIITSCSYVDEVQDNLLIDTLFVFMPRVADSTRRLLLYSDLLDARAEGPFQLTQALADLPELVHQYRLAFTASDTAPTPASARAWAVLLSSRPSRRAAPAATEKASGVV